MSIGNYNYDEFQGAYDDSDGSGGGGGTALLASLFNDAAQVASTAIATNSRQTVSPALYNYGSGQTVAGAGLMFPHQGSSTGILVIVAIGAVAFLLLRKRA